MNLLENLYHYGQDLADAWLIKLCLSIVTPIFLALFDINVPAQKAVLILIAIDLGLGVLVAYKKEQISMSKFLNRGATKFFGVGLVLAVLKLNETGIDFNFLGFFEMELTFVSLYCAFMSTNETVSILRHLSFFNVPGAVQFSKLMERHSEKLSDSFMSGGEKK